MYSSFIYARSNYQPKIWLQSSEAHMEIDSLSVCGGWKVYATGLHIIWNMQYLPQDCIELVACGCKTKCRMASCKCNKSGQICMAARGCNAENCQNPAGHVDDSNTIDLDN